jgi:hypothetical protein
MARSRANAGGPKDPAAHLRLSNSDPREAADQVRPGKPVIDGTRRRPKPIQAHGSIGTNGDNYASPYESQRIPLPPGASYRSGLRRHAARRNRGPGSPPQNPSGISEAQRRPLTLSGFEVAARGRGCPSMHLASCRGNVAGRVAACAGAARVSRCMAHPARDSERPPPAASCCCAVSRVIPRRSAA